MGKAFDVIVMGARCAGSPTAMLLARKGYRVLAIDRASFPSDTVSTHLVHPRAVDALSRWGLLDRLVATGCPPIHTYSFDFGAFTIAGAPGMDKDAVAYCPRRTILDKVLVDAAANPVRRSRRASSSRKSLSRESASSASRADRSTAAPLRNMPKSSWGPTAALHAERGGSPRAVSREAAFAGGLLQLVAGAAHGRPLRNLYPQQARICGDADPRRSDARHCRMALREVYGKQEGHRGQLPERRSNRLRTLPKGCAAPRAKHRSPAQRCRTIFASLTAQAGLSRETPATTGTS